MATDDRLTLLKQAIAKLKEDGVQSVGVDALVAVAGGDGIRGPRGLTHFACVDDRLRRRAAS